MMMVVVVVVRTRVGEERGSTPDLDCRGSDTAFEGVE